jgi:hypothetical protein
VREQRKLRLDEPVGQYVGGLHPRVAETTIAQLFSHRAGRGAAFGAKRTSGLTRAFKIQPTFSVVTLQPIAISLVAVHVHGERIRLRVD